MFSAFLGDLVSFRVNFGERWREVPGPALRRTTGPPALQPASPGGADSMEMKPEVAVIPVSEGKSVGIKHDGL